MLMRSQAIVLSVGVVVLLGCPRVLCADFHGGSGEPDDPYQIATVGQLLSIDSDPNLLRKSYVLVNDLDLDPDLPEGKVFNTSVLAKTDDTPFSGVFDAKGYAIRNLVIEGVNESCDDPFSFDSSPVGLLGFIDADGRITNLTIENASVSGCSDVGSLAGRSEGVIDHCTSSGVISGSEYATVGGLVGTLSGNGAAIYCSSTATVSGNCAGGLLGRLADNTTVTYCHSTGSVTGDYYAGGLIGDTFVGGTVAHCYTAGVVRSSHAAGGLFGEADEVRIMSSSSTSTIQGSIAGGLAGRARDVQIISSHSTTDVEGDDAGGLIGEASDVQLMMSYSRSVVRGENTGGLIGRSGDTITMACYSISDVKGVCAGGLIGKVTLWDEHILHSYATGVLDFDMQRQQQPFGDVGIGGLVGFDYTHTSIVSCFWDVEATEVPQVVGGRAFEHEDDPPYPNAGRNTQQMQTEDTFVSQGWGMGSTWTLCQDAYPQLAWEETLCPDTSEF